MEIYTAPRGRERLSSMQLYLDTSAATVENDESSEDHEDSGGNVRRKTVVDVTPGKSETEMPSSQFHPTHYLHIN